MRMGKAVAEYWDGENNRTDNKPDYLHYILLKRLLKDIGSPNNKKVLDIGCGYGDLLSEFKKNGAEVYGVDISQESLKICNEKGISVVKADCRNIPFKDNTFDVVYSIGVVEHVMETDKAINEHMRVCKPNGIVVVIVPNRLSPFFILGFVYYLLKGNYRYGMLATKGKSYTKRSLMIEDTTAFYGSAFLKETTKTLNKELADKIEDSWLSKMFGHLLYAKVIQCPR